MEVEEVIGVAAAGADALGDVCGEGLRILGPGKLVVVRGADVDEGLDCDTVAVCVGLLIGRGCGSGGRGRVEGCVMDGVAVDLTDVEVILDLGYAVRYDAVGYAPHPIRGVVMVVG